MKKPLFLLSCLFVLNSCATILNPRHKAMTIYTPAPSKIIIRKDTLYTEDNEAHFLVARSKAPLDIQFIADTVQKVVSIPFRRSVAYYLNIPYTYGLGMLVDQTNPKRFTYPRRIYLDSNWALVNDFSRFPTIRKGDFNFQVSFPYINSFITQPLGEPLKSNTGFWGLGLGLDYYHQNRQYLSLNLRTVSDFFFPLPAPFTYEDGREFMSSNYLSVSNHHRNKRFDWGYGLSWVENKWGQDFYGEATDTISIPVINRQRHQALGLMFSGYYFTGRSFHLGLIYRPSFIRLYTTSIYKYEHLISLDLAWKIRL